MGDFLQENTDTEKFPSLEIPRPVQDLLLFLTKLNILREEKTGCNLIGNMRALNPFLQKLSD